MTRCSPRRGYFLRAALLALVTGLWAQDVPDARAQQAALVFKWAKVPGAVAYVIEVATDRGFSSPVTRQRVSKTSFRLSKHSGAGYWWRVRAIDRDGRYGPFSKPRYAVRHVSAPKLLAPASGTKIAVKSGATPVSLRWSPDARLGRYLLSVASDPGFTNVIARRTVRGQPRTTVNVPGVGTYWWRVGGVTQTGRTIAASGPRKFMVTARAPSLIGPSKGSRVSLPVGGSTRVSLRFEGVGIKRYTVQVSTGPGFAESTSLDVVAGDGAAQRVSYRVTRPGWYRWRVKGRSPATGWSSVRSFKAAVRARELQLISPKDGATVALRHFGAPKVALVWKAPRGLDRFEVEVLDEVSGARETYPSDAPQRVVEAAGALWKTAGVRAIRVRGLGKKPTAWSPPVRVNVVLPPRLPAPVALTGDDGNRWGKVVGAQTYQTQPCSSATCTVPGTVSAAGPQPNVTASVATTGWSRARAIDRWGRPGAWSSALRIRKPGTTGDPSTAADRPLDHHLDVGVGVGVLYNFGGLISPEPRLEITYWPPLLDNRLGVQLAAAYATSTLDLTSSQQDLALSSTVHTLGIELSVVTRFDWQPVNLVIGAGVRMTPVFASIDGLKGGERSATTIQWGGVLSVGIEGRLGPGRLFLDLSYGKSTIPDELVIVEPSGFRSTVGYRLEVF